MFVDFEGTAKFAKIFEHNRDMGENLDEGDQKRKILAEQGHYVLNVYISPETKKQMIEEGVPDKGLVGQLFKEDNEGNTFYKAKRPHFNPRIQGGKEMGPPVVMDAGDVDWDDQVLIGNGSKLKVRLDVWDGKISTLHAVRVLELTEYVPDSSGLGGF
jgi:hypothetical protein